MRTDSQSSALTSPKFSRFACLRNSVNAYRSFILRTRLPPRFFLLPSMGLGSGLANLTGGGSCNLSNFFSISSLNRSPISPWTLSWQASTRAANVHLFATKRAALRRRSWWKRRAEIYFSTQSLFGHHLLDLCPERFVNSKWIRCAVTFVPWKSWNEKQKLAWNFECGVESSSMINSPGQSLLLRAKYEKIAGGHFG